MPLHPVQPRFSESRVTCKRKPGKTAREPMRRNIMKKPALISTLAFAAIAATSLALPATASASAFQNVVEKQQRGEQHRVHNVTRHRDDRKHGHTRWAPSPRHSHRGHDYGHHYGHHYGRQHKHRYDNRPTEHYRHHRNDDVRVRIFYDLHL
jgi:Ni/Co efflux regulator RcnB